METPRECKTCHEIKPPTEYYRRKGYLARQCKACEMRGQHSWSVANAPIAAARSFDPRVCRTCGETKAADDFYRSQGYPTRVCKECTKQRQKAWIAANRQKHHGYTEKWRKAHPEKAVAYVTARRKRDPDFRRQADKVKLSRRRARLRAGGVVTRAERQSLVVQYGSQCLACGAPGDMTTLVMDHVIPLALGGGNTIANIQPLCVPCNNHKHLGTTDYRRPK